MILYLVGAHGCVQQLMKVRGQLVNVDDQGLTQFIRLGKQAFSHSGLGTWTIPQGEK